MHAKCCDISTCAVSFQRATYDSGIMQVHASGCIKMLTATTVDTLKITGETKKDQAAELAIP